MPDECELDPWAVALFVDLETPRSYRGLLESHAGEA